MSEGDNLVRMVLDESTEELMRDGGCIFSLRPWSLLFLMLSLSVCTWSNFVLF